MACKTEKDVEKIPQHGEHITSSIHISLYALPANELPQEKYLQRHVIKEVAAACSYRTDVWRDLGIELLGEGEKSGLDVIRTNNDNVTKCCTNMLALWCQLQPNASWSQLIEALKKVKLNRIASEIENRLKPSVEQQEKIVSAMQDMKITAQTQQQVQQTKEENMQRESNKGI